MLDPNTAATLTLDEIDALCDELTRAHGAALPTALRAAGNPIDNPIVIAGRSAS
jgi:alpha-galactosidase